MIIVNKKMAHAKSGQTGQECVVSLGKALLLAMIPISSISGQSWFRWKTPLLVLAALIFMLTISRAHAHGELEETLPYTAYLSTDVSTRREAFRQIPSLRLEDAQSLFIPLSMATSTSDERVRGHAFHALLALAPKLQTPNETICIYWSNQVWRGVEASSDPVFSVFPSLLPLCRDYLVKTHAARRFISDEKNGRPGSPADESVLVAFGSAAIPDLIVALGWNSDIAELATRVLIRIGKPAVPALASALHASDTRVPTLAMRALFAIGLLPDESIPTVIAFLNDGNFDHQFNASALLVKTSSSTLPALTEALRSKNDGLNVKVIEVLQHIDSPVARMAVEHYPAFNVAVPHVTSDFASPKKKFIVRFTEIDLLIYDRTRVTNVDQTDHAVYRLDFLGSGGVSVTSATYSDVYGWATNVKPAPLAALFQGITWSPEEDFAILPGEAWASAPGTNNRLAVALNRKLPWKTAHFELDHLYWVDSMIVIGNDSQDCSYSVNKFDGHMGQMITVKASHSPIGYNLISLKGAIALIRQETDNCGTQEKLPSCFSYDLRSHYEERVACP